MPRRGVPAVGVQVWLVRGLVRAQPVPGIIREGAGGLAFALRMTADRGRLGRLACPGVRCLQVGGGHRISGRAVAGGSVKSPSRPS